MQLISPKQTIVFSQRNENTLLRFDFIVFGNYKIDRIEECKYLRLYLNQSLNFTNHIDIVKSKVSKFVGVLKRISNYITIGKKFKIYYAFIHSHLIYLNPIWNAAPQYKLNELQIMQNKAMKLIHSLPRLTPSVSLYSGNDKTIPIHSLCEYELCLLIYKLEQNLLKSDFNFVRSHEVHNHFTRCANYLRAFFRRINVTKNSIYSRGIDLYNNVPDNIRNEQQLVKFRVLLRNFMKQKFIDNPTL